MDYLVDSKKVEKKLFSMNLTLANSGITSTIQIGGYDSVYISKLNKAYYQPPNLINWLNLTSASYW